jgi:hypothetical protein
MHKTIFSNNQLFESLSFKDMEGLIKPTIHVDEFSSKMGDDDDVIVVSFFVRDPQAAKDLMAWFEKGYDFVLDADKSPGEVKPNRYLVYVEIRRRSTAGQHVETLLADLNTLTEYNVDDWVMHYKGDTMPFSRDTFDSAVPLSPKAYREKYEKDLNEVRVSAGLPYKQIYETDADLKSLQAAAGLR